MTLLLRVLGWLALATFGALWASAAWMGLSLVGGYVAAIVLAVVLIGLRLFWPLCLAAFAGTFVIWHWPILVCAMLAFPRALLMLPGLVSTQLASWRHPRARWS